MFTQIKIFQVCIYFLAEDFAGDPPDFAFCGCTRASTVLVFTPGGNFTPGDATCRPLEPNSARNID